MFLRKKPNNQRPGSECGLRQRLDSSPQSAQTDCGELFLSPHSAPINIAHASRVESIECLSIRARHFHESVPRFNQPSKSGVKNSEWVGIPAYVHTHVCKSLHHLGRSKFRTRARHKNLAAQFRKASGRRHASFVCQRLKLSDGLLQQGNPLSYKRQFVPSLLKLLLSSQVARLIGIEVDVRHTRGIV
jgi:hypothetical protein